MFVRLAPAATLLLLCGPIVAGLMGTLLPALGYLPAIGRSQLSLDPWRELGSTPGLSRSIGVSLLVGFGATLISLAATVLLAATSHGTLIFKLIRRSLSPILAIPHVAVAVGLAFVIAPSGLLFRLWGSYLGGPVLPPDLLIVNDTWGLSLITALVLKEIPFLFLMVLAALPQVDADRSLALARTLGYSRIASWLKVVLPRVYPQIRLPVLAVLAYSLSVVDMALVLGPTTPPTLPVQLLKWINDPDLAFRFRASAGALLQLALVGASILLWLVTERLLARIAQPWVEAGGRTCADRLVRLIAGALGLAILLLIVSAIASIVLWSFAEAWRFPNPLPASFTLANWRGESAHALALLANSFWIAGGSAVIALMLVIGCLENEVRRGRDRWEMKTLWLLYIPLLVPQIAFLLGLQILLIQANWDETLPAVLLTHLIFVLPYVFLSLAEPWRAFDNRYRQVALTLGASPLRVLIAVRLPMLLRACLVAVALGFAVSIAQYLATQLVAGARWPTITTEAIAVSSGGNRRILAIYALLQMLLPFAAFVVATLLPNLLFRNRRGMGHL